MLEQPFEGFFYANRSPTELSVAVLLMKPDSIFFNLKPLAEF